MGGGLTRRDAIVRGAIGAGALATSSLWWPTLSRAQGPTVTNLVTNPRLGTSLTRWLAYGETGPSSIARRTDDGVAPGSACAEVTFTSSSTLHRGAALIMQDAPMPCSAGQVVWVEASGKKVSGSAGAELWLTIAYRNSLGQFIQETPLQKVTATGGWQTLRGFEAAPSGAASCYVGVWLVNSPLANSQVRAANAMVVLDPPTMPFYFDGATSGGAWTGAAHASTSTAPAPTPAAPVHPGFLAGWNDNSVLQTGWTPLKDADLNADIGMTVLRVGCDLRGGWVDASGNVTWSAVDTPPYKIDQLNALCAARGIKLLPIPLGAPSWMLPAGTSPSAINPPAAAYNAAWADICVQMADRWGPNLAGIEIWNEPNLNPFWATGPNAAQYTQLLIAASDALAVGHSDIRVVAGGLGGRTTDEAGKGIAVGNFLSGMFANGAHGKFDALSFHPYMGAVRTSNFHDSLRQVRTAMAAAGDTSPLWIDEIGLSTGGTAPVSEANQAAGNRLLYALLKQQSDVQVVCWHTSVSGSQHAIGSLEKGYEFVERITERRKPTYAAVKAELAGEP